MIWKNRNGFTLIQKISKKCDSMYICKLIGNKRDQMSGMSIEHPFFGYYNQAKWEMKLEQDILYEPLFYIYKIDGYGYHIGSPWLTIEYHPEGHSDVALKIGRCVHHLVHDFSKRGFGGALKHFVECY